MRILSMTGFGSAEGPVGENRYRVEVKALNHRFLDLKVRLPREFSSAELPLRALIQTKFTRGSLDLKVERAADGAISLPPIQVNVELAKSYLEQLRNLARSLGLPSDVKLEEIARFPEVIARGSSDLTAEAAWSALSPLVERTLQGLAEMRATEGAHLHSVLVAGLDELSTGLQTLREKRAAVAGKYSERIREKIRSVFEAFPLAEGTAASLQTVIESRMAQELSLLADRTDIEEELARFQGHLGHFRKVLGEGGAVGRKLDFILQELNREINTLGNKAQDFSMSEDVVQMKVKLEQLREQAMNLE